MITMARKQPRKNVKKEIKIKRRKRFIGRCKFCLAVIAGAASVTIMSGCFILVHDILTQGDYFKAEKIVIEGENRLSKAEITRRAGIHKGINIIGVNLSAVRNGLLAHPWIAAAEVRREIPSGLWIKIVEHRPLAIVDLGTKYLINDQGRVFKEWQTSDPANLPIVNGLSRSDLIIHTRKSANLWDRLPGIGVSSQTEESSSIPLEAVMQVLNLGRESESILPNRQVKMIRVDREIGITLYAFDRIKSISLGYDDYASKYQMLARLLKYMQRQARTVNFDRIDLNDLNRIVVNSVTASAVQAGS